MEGTVASAVMKYWQLLLSLSPKEKWKAVGTSHSVMLCWTSFPQCRSDCCPSQQSQLLCLCCLEVEHSDCIQDTVVLSQPSVLPAVQLELWDMIHVSSVSSQFKGSEAKTGMRGSPLQWCFIAWGLRKLPGCGMPHMSWGHGEAGASGGQAEQCGVKVGKTGADFPHHILRPPWKELFSPLHPSLVNSWTWWS